MTTAINGTLDRVGTLRSAHPPCCCSTFTAPLCGGMVERLRQGALFGTGITGLAAARRRKK